MRGPRSRSGAAWAVSTLLHLLIGALVLRAAERAALKAPAADAVELEFEVAPAPAPPPPEALPEAPARASSAAPPRTPRPPQRAENQQDREAPPIAREGGESAAPAAPPDEGEGVDRPIDLSFGALPDEVKGHFAGAPEVTLRARPRRFDLDELRAQLERKEDAVANVEKGRVDPVLYDYLRGARTRFQENAEKLADDLSVGPGDMVRAWGRGYMHIVDEVNRGAYSTENRRAAPADAKNEKSVGADALGAYGHARRGAEAGAEQRRAEVCVDVAAGREPTVALRRSSGNPALDRLTLESFTKSVAARPVPADARRGLACYELRISAYRMPPLPSISCGVGRSGLTCVWPFKKITNVRGRLLNFEDRPADGVAARASPLIRKPR